jgi:hypothetical protein
MNTEEHPDESLLRRYLLGDRMADAEQDRIEKSYFDCDQYFDRLLEVEDDLIDTYIRGGLSPTECAQFERHFLAAKRRRDRYEAMRAIAASFFRVSPRTHPSLFKGFRDFFVMQSPTSRTAMAVLGAVTIVAVGLLGVGYVRLWRESVNAHALLANTRQAPAPAFLTFTLRPGLLRSGAGTGNQIRVEPGVEWLALRLETPALREYSWFAAALSTAPGEEVLRQNRLVPAGDAIDLRTPAGVLTPGQDYTVSLVGLKPDGQRVDLQSYAFHVTK